MGFELNDAQKKRLDMFLNLDVIDFRTCPVRQIRDKLSGCMGGTINMKGISKTNRKNYTDLLKSIFYNDMPYDAAHSTGRVRAVFTYDGFFRSLGDIDFCIVEKDELKSMFYEYCDKNGYNKEIKKTILTCQRAIIEYRDARKGFDRDFWDKKIINISPERINKSRPFCSMDHRLIKNEENREYVKLYMKHLICDTELSYSTIYGMFSTLNMYCESLGAKSILKASRKDVLGHAQKKAPNRAESFNKIINTLSDFYKYLAIKQITLYDTPVTKDMFKTVTYNNFANCVDDYTIEQIFNNIHKAPFNLMVMFLINYCTGMRISDVCLLKTDCLYYDGDGGYFVEYVCQKMKKPQRNLIPHALYELIGQQIKIVGALPYKEEYLFPSTRVKNAPYPSSTFTVNFKKLCHEWGIKNADGTDYNYTSHSYRHTLASELYQKYGIDAVTIQFGVLYHKELNMSLKYIERPSEFKKMQEDRYLAKTGEVTLSEWMKDNLRGRVLSNGICNQPQNLPACPNADACIDCMYFATSKKFLPVLSGQLSAIKSRLPIYEANGYLPNLKTAKGQIKTLERIIKRLEEE